MVMMIDDNAYDNDDDDDNDDYDDDDVDEIGLYTCMYAQLDVYIDISSS